MRLPDSEHSDRSWRIDQLTGDFHLEDVWAIPAPAGHDPFGTLLTALASRAPLLTAPALVRALFAIRERLGLRLGWDGPDRGLGARVDSLHTRLPADLLVQPAPRLAGMPFEPLYRLDDEYAAETANETVHAVLHLGWVPYAPGGARAQLAVLVKTNGVRGAAYMAAIKPFRYAVVYPALLGAIERSWHDAALAGR
jgi:hypothetical protein